MHSYYKNAVLEMDRNIDLESETAYCAAMLIAALKHGAVDDIVISKTKVPEGAGRIIAKRLRQQGIWRNDQTHHAGWDDLQNGGIAFWCDVGVGTGMLRRTPKSEKE